MNAEELVKNGKLAEALKALQQEIRNKPEDQRLRIFLFQLNCVMGQLDKALNQLQVLSSLTADTMLLAQTFQPVIACELLRRDIFAGKRTPILFGEPMDWVGPLVQANDMIAKGQYDAAAELRDQAFEAAPTTPASANATPFACIPSPHSPPAPLLKPALPAK